MSPGTRSFSFSVSVFGILPSSIDHYSPPIIATVAGHPHRRFVSSVDKADAINPLVTRFRIAVSFDSMKGNYSKGYAWAISAGLNAALAAIAAKLFSSQLIKYGFVIFFNVTMWGCYVNSLKALSSLQATVTNFATNFLSSGLAGFLLFEETLSAQWFAGAIFIVLGVFILSKSSIEKKASSD